MTGASLVTGRYNARRPCINEVFAFKTKDELVAEKVQ